jgi:UDP-N-acetyl-D-glucosamine dehydrogenase
MNVTIVIGQGYVGLPLAREVSEAGLDVIGLDLNSGVVDSLNSGISHVDDISNADMKSMIDRGYRASTDASLLAEAEHVVICVPTPLGDDGRPDLRAVVGASESIAAHMTPGTTVVLESTTYPGTTEELVLPILQSSGLVLDRDFWLAFSPERIDPGNPTYGLRNTPKVVGGVSAASTVKAVSFYDQLVDQTVPVRGAKEAETSKLLENTYRHINIALVNEMAKFCHELGIDLWDVIDAAKTKPFGFQAFYPGPGVGGHCIPIDPNYLSYEVEKRLGYPFRFVELAQEINNSMPRYVVSRIQDLLNTEKKSLNGAKTLLLGVTYKANIADQRESPAMPIASLLREKGAEVQFHDPRVENWRVDRTAIVRVADLQTAVREADICVLLQNHNGYDVGALAGHSKLFFDTRGQVPIGAGVRL